MLSTFKTLSACPDTEFIPVPPLAISKVPDVIEVVGIEAKENVPKETIFKISPALAPAFKIMLVPLVATKSFEAPFTRRTPFKYTSRNNGS